MVWFAQKDSLAKYLPLYTLHFTLYFLLHAMTAITDLNQLLAHMEPVLQAGEYVFCTFADKKYGDLAELDPLCAYREAEGLTLILPKASADLAQIDYDGTYRAITLQVHSSLEAVGLTAAVATELAAHNISANVVAAYYHDHVFVQSGRAAEAVQVLQSLSAKKR